MAEERDDVRRVVAAVDLTETGANALREAMRLARRLNSSELHAVYVLDTNPGTHDAQKIAELSEALETASTQLKEHVLEVCAPDEAEDDFEQELVVHVRLGRPADAIHQLCVDIDADLVVVGTHQRTGLAKLLLGSVAEQLIERARLPVVVAHPKNYADLPRSAKADAPRDGDFGDGLTQRETLHFRPRTSHISGLV